MPLRELHSREQIEQLRADVDCFAASESLADDLTCLAVAVGPRLIASFSRAALKSWSA